MDGVFYYAGIIVTTQNVELPTYEARYGSAGFGYVGAENYSAGANLGRGVIDVCGLAEGDEVFVWGLLAQDARGQRTQGVIDAVEEAGVSVVYLEISDAVNADAPQGIPVFTSVLASNPEVAAAVMDHGALTATLPTYLEAAGKGPDEVCGAGFDLSAATAQGIEDGFIDVVLDQQPFLQGYLPVVQMYLAARFGFAGMHIDTGEALITADNIAAVAPLAEAAIR